MFGIEPIWAVVAVLALAVMLFGWGVLFKPFGFGKSKQSQAPQQSQATPEDK